MARTYGRQKIDLALVLAFVEDCGAVNRNTLIRLTPTTRKPDSAPWLIYARWRSKRGLIEDADAEARTKATRTTLVAFPTEDGISGLRELFGTPAPARRLRIRQAPAKRSAHPALLP